MISSFRSLSWLIELCAPVVIATPLGTVGLRRFYGGPPQPGLAGLRNFMAPTASGLELQALFSRMYPMMKATLCSLYLSARSEGAAQQQADILGWRRYNMPRVEGAKDCGATGDADNTYQVVASRAVSTGCQRLFFFAPQRVRYGDYLQHSGQRDKPW